MFLEDLLIKLSKERPVFNMEADFQHAFGWKIHTEFPHWKIRFEKKPPNLPDRIFIDLWIDGDFNHVIELKYKTKKTELIVNDETFNLLNHGAQDLGRYDFLKDVERLEKIIQTHENTKGYAIMLTNDPSYWKPPVKNTVDTQFRIHESREINSDELKWTEAASSGTTRGREKPLKLNGNYKFGWKDYSQTVGNSGNFRYLFVEIF